MSILAAFLPPFMASALNVALPTIGREFSMPAVHLSWLITSYLLAIAVFIVPFGRAGDLYGRRKIFLYGTLLYTGATLFAGCAPSALLLLAFRIVQGIGAAMIFCTGMAMLAAAVSSLGMAVTAAGLFFLSRITAVAPLTYVISGLVMIGAGVAFFASPNTSAIMGSVDRSSYGMASSIVGTMRLIGQMLSMGIVTVMLSAIMGNAVVTPERNGAFVASVRITFVIFGTLCCLGIFASLSRGRMRPHGGTDRENARVSATFVE